MLAVSIGTAEVSAALARRGRASVLRLGGGPGRSLPAAVAVRPDGSWLVGGPALDAAVTFPAACERSPIRGAGEGRMLLDGRLVPVHEALGALVGEVVTVAEREGGERPDDLRLTHPASWRAARVDALGSAARRAGYDEVSLVPEPVAVAAAMGRHTVADGAHVAVFHMGAGAFEATVLQKTCRGFVVAGRPGRRDPLGGDDIDELVIAHLGGGPAGEHADWPQLVRPGDEEWRREALAVRASVRAAKEALSEGVAATVPLPRLGMAPQLTRAELEPMVGPLVDSALDVLEDVLESAGVKARDLAAVYLAGGSSRIPLVGDRVWERLGVRPELAPEPEAAAALGAVGGVAPVRLARASKFRGRIAAATVTSLWNRGSVGSAYLVVAGDQTTVRASDEPRRGEDVAALARESAAALAQSRTGYAETGVVPCRVLDREGGLERRYTVLEDDGEPVAHFERYLQIGDRWIVVRSPEHVRDVADRLVIEAPAVDPRRYVELRFGVDLPEGWDATERVLLLRNGSDHRVVAESYRLHAGTTPETLAGFRASSFAAPAYAEAGRGRGRFLGRNEAATITLRRVADGYLTRIWAGIVDGRGYTVVATVPGNERLALGLLENHMVLH